MNKAIRLAAPALAAAVVLLTGACGSDGDGEAKDDKPETEETAGGDAGDSGDSGDGEAGAGLDSAYTGVWASDTGEGLLRLGEDRIATLVLESGVCVGAAADAAGQTVINVQCEQPGEYGTGRATVDGQALTVAWEDAGERTYTWLADVDVDLADLPLDELDLDFEGFDPSRLDLDGIDLSELEDMLPPGGDVDFGSD